MSQNAYALPTPSINLNVTPQGSYRTTSNIDFSAQLKRALTQGTATASNTLSTAAPFVPGAAVLSAVLSNAANQMNTIPASLGAPDMGGGMSMGMGMSGGNNFTQSVEQMQQKMMSMNLYMLGVQSEVQRMSEQHSTISNMLKAEHETKKTAINNFR